MEKNMIFNSYAQQREELAGIKIVSCGHVFAKPGREINRPEGRRDWLLFYVAKGSETFYTDSTVVADAGSFIIFAPGEKQHHAFLGTGTAEFYFVHFSCDALPTGITLDTSRVYSSVPVPGCTAIFEEIIDETLQKRPHYEMLCITQLLRLLTLMQREVNRMEDTGAKNMNRIAKAIQHMNRYCEANLSLEEYANICCMSKYHFLRIFKQVTGLPPLEYRNRVRLERAQDLLLTSTLSISEIADACGYSSPAYFSDSFRSATGSSPTEYRRSHPAR